MPGWIPDSWCVPGMLEMVLDLLANLPMTADDKKQGLIDWCDCAGVVITAEMVERVTGLPAGEV